MFSGSYASEIDQFFPAIAEWNVQYSTYEEQKGFVMPLLNQSALLIPAVGTLA
jgi:hypothetical protein